MKHTNGNGTSGNIPFDEGMCERYLLGELNESEQERFETAYFEDDAFFNRFLAVKDELLDLYARNELDAAKRQRIESHFQSTAPRRRRIDESREFISAVTKIANGTAPNVPSAQVVEFARPGLLESLKRIFAVPALAALGLLLILFAVGFWIINRPVAVPDQEAKLIGQENSSSENSASAEASVENPPPDKDQNVPVQGQAERSPEPKRSENVESVSDPMIDPPASDTGVPVPSPSVEPVQPQPPPKTAPTPLVAEVIKPEDPKPDATGDRTESVTLSSTSRSVTKSNTASIGTATKSVIVRMLFGGEAYASYSVRVTSLGGGTVWRASGLTTSMKDGAKSLAVTVPAGSLSRKDYIVVLEGRSSDGKLETIREYYLHVDRR